MTGQLGHFEHCVASDGSEIPEQTVWILWLMATRLAWSLSFFTMSHPIKTKRSFQFGIGWLFLLTFVVSLAVAGMAVNLVAGYVTTTFAICIFWETVQYFRSEDRRLHEYTGSAGGVLAIAIPFFVIIHWLGLYSSDQLAPAQTVFQFSWNYFFGPLVLIGISFVIAFGLLLEPLEFLLKHGVRFLSSGSILPNNNTIENEIDREG